MGEIGGILSAGPRIPQQQQQQQGRRRRRRLLPRVLPPVFRGERKVKKTQQRLWLVSFVTEGTGGRTAVVVAVRHAASGTHGAVPAVERTATGGVSGATVRWHIRPNCTTISSRGATTAPGSATRRTTARGNSRLLVEVDDSKIYREHLVLL